MALSIIQGSDILPWSEPNISACCGVKNISMSLNDDGSTSASVTGLRDDAIAVLDHLMYGAYTIDSLREEGINVTITGTSVDNDVYEVVPSGAIFKTIPSDIYALHMDAIVTRTMQSPLDAPDSDIYIRSSDIYGTDGWTCSEIVRILNIDATIPSSFDYHVYQLSVTRGTPIISFLSSLFPFPGLIIERVGSHYYVNQASGRATISPIGWYVCSLQASSSKSKRYDVTVVGAPGEPRGIIGSSGVTGGCGAAVELNLVGGVWAVIESTSTNTSSTSKMAAMFNE